MFHLPSTIDLKKAFQTLLSPKANQRQKRLRKHLLRGFSLIEVMVSSALLVIAITGTLTAFTSATRVYEHQRKSTHAITIAESTLEDLLLRFQGDNQTKIYAGEYGPHCYSRVGKFLKDASSSSCPDGTYYNVTWVSSAVDLLDDIIRLEVIVRWNEAQGAKDIRLTTLRN
ncbi:MAG: prepilin-type N-terminal cleavage/methylation domain-containing protein [Deltaproteobacteria bacterium]|nr:prepilin-type N-terminal cleavage/methylation domain-containing protein [Deltaproteobacteria bacterium]